MPHTPLNAAFVPRNGRKLVVVIVARISTDKQDPQSLQDQVAKAKEYLQGLYGGEIEFIIIASQGCGEHLDREELYELERQIESRTVDIVIAEDLSRICRRRRAYDFCEMCVDFDARLIAINDHVDTGVDGWEDTAFFATWHHERSNRDTADRIKQRLNNRFTLGGVVQFIIFGYIKPPGTKSDSDLRKDLTVEQIVLEIFRRLDNGSFYTEVADWLNEIGIKPGPYCRRGKWTGPLVRAFVHQPILKGFRVRNRMVSRRFHKTGRHKSVKGDPRNWLFRSCPHLAFFEPAYYDRVINKLDARNSRSRRTANGQPDPRQHVPRSRTAFPGQHARCGICGRRLNWHTSKHRSYLLCKGAYGYQCWNSLYVYGPESAKKISDAVLSAIGTMPDFEAVYADIVRDQLSEFTEHRSKQRQTLARQLAEVDSNLSNLVSFIAQGNQSTTISSQITTLEQKQMDLRFQLQQLDEAPSPDVALPGAQELRQRFVAALQHLSQDDQETGRLLRQLLPDLHIVPYAICDGSDIVARAEFTLTLVPLLPNEFQSRSESQVFTKRMVVTLGSISQPVALYAEAASLQQQGLKQREIRERLGWKAQSSVERALRIYRIMVRDGLTEPFIRLTSLPDNCHRLHRHEHPRYRFEPLPGYPQ